MKVTAKDILGAIRKKYIKFPVIREVVVDDTDQFAIYNQYRQNRHPDIYTDHFARDPDKYPLLPVPEGWSPASAKYQRRIDALLFEPKYRTAVEIKVTRADFRADTEEKRAPWVAVTHKFVYAVPKGLVTPEEVPDYCGLWEFDPGSAGYGEWQHGMTVAKKAKIRKEPRDLPDRVYRALLGRLSFYEREQER